MKRFLLVCLVVVFFPACQQYVSWGEKTFKQADAVCYSLDKARTQVKTEELLTDIFSTIDVINVLPRTNEVIKAHEHLRAEAVGEGVAETEKAIATLQEENKQQSVFFVALYGDKQEWRFSLCKNGKTYEAHEVKRGKFDRWYHVIFGKKVTRFKKNTYTVTFNTPMELPVELRASNGEYTAMFAW